VVETTGITGNYRNDLLTLETGYLEPHCWYPFAILAPRGNILINAAITSSRAIVDCTIPLAIMEIKKILPLPENQRSPMNMKSHRIAHHSPESPLRIIVN